MSFLVGVKPPKRSVTLSFSLQKKISNKNMKGRGKGGLLDFCTKDERNKENSFLDVDWMITELINYGHEKMVPNDSDSSPNDTSNAGRTPRRSASFKSPITKPKPKKVSEVLLIFRSGELIIFDILIMLYKRAQLFT